MPIFKRCPHCGKRVPEGQKCTCGWKRDYEKPEGTRKLYHGTRWKKLQKTVMSMYSGMDLYAELHGRVEYADTVHHIVPAEEDPSRFYDVSNLIPLSRHSHDEVHARYRQGTDAKSQCQEELRSLLKNINDYVGLGV